MPNTRTVMYAPPRDGTPHGSIFSINLPSKYTSNLSDFTPGTPRQESNLITILKFDRRAAIMFTTNYKSVAARNAIGNSRRNLHLFPALEPLDKSNTRKCNFLSTEEEEPLFVDGNNKSLLLYFCDYATQFPFPVQFKINESGVHRTERVLGENSICKLCFPGAQGGTFRKERNQDRGGKTTGTKRN